MKTHILCIILSFGFFTMNAQEFEETTSYLAQLQITTKEQQMKGAKIQIFANENSQKVATITTADAANFDALNISVLKKPALNNIREIIKVELEYHAYSLEIESYYFLVTLKGDFISLPKVTKVYDDVVMEVEDYVFPTQKYGKEESIIRAKYRYTENYSIKGIEVVQRFAWNDDDFDQEDAVTANQ